MSFDRAHNDDGLLNVLLVLNKKHLTVSYLLKLLDLFLICQISCFVFQLNGYITTQENAKVEHF